MKSRRLIAILVSLVALLVVLSAVYAQPGPRAAVDLTHAAGIPVFDAAGTEVDPFDINPNLQAGILDDFNRPDGPIGPDWTNQNATFQVVNNAAQGGFLALATYNGGEGTVLEADVETNGTSLQYTGLVLDYADINNSLFIKVQQQNSSGMFEYAACYIGNNGSGGNFGLGFFALDAPFATAHMKVSTGGGSVTIEFSNIDGGGGSQTYTCTGAPNTGGTGIGILGYNTIARLDNFASNVGGTGEIYSTIMRGENEVPPVVTDAVGRTDLRDEGGLVRYRLAVLNIVDATAAHIHCAPVGVNGPVGVTLFSGGPVSGSGQTIRTFTAPDPGNGCGWADLNDVMAAIASGDTYVNVHTLANPGGEIRGQLAPLP